MVATTQSNVHLRIEVSIDFDASDLSLLKVVTFTTPHIGRRARIVMAVVEALGKIKQGHPANRIAWQNQSPDSGDTYPLSVKAVLLEPLQPVNLERDGLLPALIVQYGDGVREYKPIRNNPNNRFSSRSSQNYATLSEYEETMMVTIRAILRPTLEATLELATEGGLTGESLTIMTAN